MAASVDTSLTRAASVDSIESSIHCDAEDAAQKTVHFTPEQREVLKKYYYELKIQSTGKAHLTAIEQISQEINCPIQKIKNWINAEQRRNKVKDMSADSTETSAEPLVEPDCTVIKIKKGRKRSGFQMYCHEHGGSSVSIGATEEHAIKYFSQKWKGLDSSEKEEWSKKGHNITVTCKKKQAIKELVTSIKENLHSLSNLGVEGYSLMINAETSDCQIVTSDTIDKFIELEKEKQHYLDHDLFKFMCGESYQELYKKRKKKESYNEMLETVRDSLKSKYMEATGKGRIPYSSLETMHCTVLGLPPGLSLKQSADYNAQELRSIFNCLSSIQFVCNN